MAVIQKWNVFSTLVLSLVCVDAKALIYGTDVNVPNKTVAWGNDVSAGTWVNIGTIDLQTVNWNNFTPELLSTCKHGSLCAGLDTLVTTGGNQRPLMHVNVEYLKSPISIEGSDQQLYLGLTFDPYDPYWTVYVWNKNNGQPGHEHPVNTDQLMVFPKTPHELPVTGKYDGPVHSNVGCYFIGGGGCSYSSSLYLRTNNYTTTKANLYAFIPDTFTLQTITFNNIPLIRISYIIDGVQGSTTQTAVATVSVSGTIKSPQRCYISLSNKMIDYNNITSSQSFESIEKNVQVKSRCNNVPSGLKQELKVQVTTTGSDVFIQDNILGFNKTTTGDIALGYTFGINKNAVCNNSEFGYNKYYLVRDNVVSNIDNQDTIYWSLCKYGIPTKFGDQDVKVAIVSKWSK